MSKARRIECWEHTARLLAAISNPWLKKPIRDPDEVNPVAYLKRPWQRRRDKKYTPGQSFNIMARGMLRG